MKALTLAVLLACSIGVRADDSVEVPTREIDCEGGGLSLSDRLSCQFSERVEEENRPGLNASIRQDVELDIGMAMVLNQVVRPATACDPNDIGKCLKEVKSTCEFLGKTGPFAYTWQVINFVKGGQGTCEGTCKDGAYVYVACVVAKMPKPKKRK